MEKSETILQELIDREKLRDIVHRYCWAVDRGTFQEVMALFHDSCELFLVPGKRYEGRAAVPKWYDGYMRNRMEVLRHLIHNQVIAIEGDTATSKSYFDVVGDLKGESTVVASFYEDKFRRVTGEWRFTEKVIRLDFLVPLHEGWGGKKIKRSLMPPEV